MTKKGVTVKRYYTEKGKDPFAAGEYETRTSIIKNPDGTVVYKIDEAEVLTSWTQVATDILAQKYFRKTGVPQADGTLGTERSIKEVGARLAGCWRHWGEKHNYFASEEDATAFEEEMQHIIVTQSGAPNSPQWFNTGLAHKYGIKGEPQGHWYVDPKTGESKRSEDAYTHPQPHACFIQSIKDDLVNDGGIFDLVTREARIFKYGSGTGTNFSTIRGSGEPLSGGGKSSGLMSFLQIFDRAAGAIKSGGTTRRAAKMVCLDLDHPEIEEFVDWKMFEEQKVADLVAGSKILHNHLTEVLDIAKETKNTDLENNPKLRTAVKRAIKMHVPLNYVRRTLQLADMGVYDMDLPVFDTHFESSAYNTVSGQNSNNSIRIPNSFFKVLDEGKDWDLIQRIDGKVMRSISSQKLWDKVCYAAWACADPGVQFDTTINEWHTCPADGRINGSNPCVTGDTLVLMNEGRWRRIDSLVNEKSTILFNTGHIGTSEIKGSFITGHKPVYLLTTSSGYEIKLTADHEVFTVNRGFIPSCELTKDDFVLLPEHEVADIEEVEDPTFYQLLGVYLGDGCGTQGQMMQLTMNKEKELSILEKFSEYSAEYSRSTHKNTPATVQITKTSGKFVVTNGQLLQKCSRFLNLSQKSHEKNISSELFNLPLGAQKYVLQGLFTADGTVANYGEKSQYISLDSSSLQLVKDVQVMLLGFGIKSKLYKNRRAGTQTAFLPDGKGNLKEYSVRETHSLRISRSGRHRFEKLVGFMPESQKNTKLMSMNRFVESYTDRMVDSIHSIEYLGEETVYDLTEPLTHTFVANGITVHNCSEYMFLDDTACNLASINLAKYLNEDNTFDIEGFKHAVRLWTIVLEISVLMAQFPSKVMAELSYKYRTLGLGYANLGTVLMRLGIPYDSDKARAIAGAFSAVMTGEAYATSAELAKELGPFPQYKSNAKDMLRVIKNHRRAAYNEAPDKYEGLTITPQGIDQELCPAPLLEAAHNAWDRALELGEQYGYRNAQTTVIAPTGTIGLVMDCDTTGVEPDFALIKFKKLAGGGYWKIVNQSVPWALTSLGYTEEQVDKITKYAVGHGTLTGCPHINPQSLREKGFTQDKIDVIESQLGSAFDLSFVFNKFTLGEDFLLGLGMTEEQLNYPNLDILQELGFTSEQIEEATRYVCGTMTVEGAPELKEEHLPVFDCANKCGKYSTRLIAYDAHIRMMAAVQPFISGAISKTINMANEATIDDIENAYRMSWKLMVKATALYRDGSKLSQTLNVSASDLDAELLHLEQEDDIDETVTPEIVQQAIQARAMPTRRSGFTQESHVGGHKVGITTSEFDDGSLAEIDVDMYKEGSTYKCLMNAFANSVSTGLKHGVPLAAYVDEFTFTKFEPAGAVIGDPKIKQASSVVDYVFRLLGSEYLERDDLVHIKEEAPKRVTHQTILSADGKSLQEAKEQGFTGEECGQCGSMKMKQNGTCSLCLDCGSTSGCS